MNQLVYIVLKKTNKFEKLMSGLKEIGVDGATVFLSSGMSKEMDEIADQSIFSALSRHYNNHEEISKTIITVVKEEQIPAIHDVVDKLVDGMDHQHTAVMFAVPVSYVAGMASLK